MLPKRLLIIIALAFVTCLPALAQQTYVVNGIVSDADEHYTIEGVNVTYKIGGKQHGTVTNSKGYFSVNLPRDVNTTLRFSFMGYKTVSKTITSSKKAQFINVEMRSNTDSLREVTVTSRVPLVLQRGDTTVFFADAYKVNRDATAMDLMQKLPAVGMRDGKLEAFGEEVKEIQIDGREYFKSDINMALKNLPAAVINEIQIYDQISDYSKLTGFDDGNTRKTINIKTRAGTARSQFGKGTAGAGIPDVYKLYGMYNLFRDDLRVSLFAQWNDINEQNFSMIDLLSATGTASSSAPTQSPYSKGQTDNSFHPTSSDDISSMMVDVSDYGVTTSRAAGANYSDEWAKGKMKFSGHYLFNSSSNYTDYNIYDQYFGETASNNLQDQRVNNDNINHRFNSKYEWQIDSMTYLMVRPALAYQRKEELSDLTDWTVTPADTSLLLNQQTATDQDVISLSGEAMLMRKFGTKGHAITADARVAYIDTDEDINMNFGNVQTADNALQQTGVINRQYTQTYMLSYILPLSRQSRLKTDVGFNKTWGMMRRKTEIMKGGEEEFTTDTLLSGSTWSEFGGFLANISYMLNWRGMNLVAGTELQVYSLYNSNDAFYFQRNYTHLLPYAFLRYKFGRSQLHVQYKASRQYPGLAQVHDAINNSNAVLAIRGNLKLEPALHHNITTRLVMPIAQNGSVFVAFANIEQADNYIGSMRTLSSESYQEDGERRNTEILSYQNTDGYFSWSGLLAYGFPWEFISSNVNLSTMAKQTKTPGYWDNNKQFTNTWNWSGSLTIGSNISENVDFVLDVNGKFTQSSNLTFTNMNVRYWTLSYGGQLNWQFLPQVKLVLEAGHTNYFGQNTSQFNALISNAALAYKFLKGRKGELRFSINDIFDQDNSFYQTTTELYRREVNTNILGRYAMLSFTYDLNTNRK